MNNGVVNNQNSQTAQPTLKPIEASTPATSAPATPTIISSTDVVSQTPATSAPTPVVQAPVTVAPAQPTLMPVTTAVPATPVTVAPTTTISPIPTTLPTTTPVVLAPSNTPTLVTPTEVASTTEVTSMKVDPSIEEKKKKKKKEIVKEEVDPNAPPKPKKSQLPLFLFLLIVAFAGYVFYSNNQYKRAVKEFQYKCSPVNETKEEVELDVNSLLVQDLYRKVATSIREDVAQPEWNNVMKIYLAYRQIPDYQMYDSNCNMFSNGRMEPYTCEVSTNFIPKAFKASTLEAEWKKLYGESTPMPLINIKLENACVGGFEWIPEREEYVQGYCKQNTATSYRVTKKLVKATSSRNTIVLTEEVTYAGNEKLELPAYLKSGTYYYTFRLDMNYNYVLLAKTYDEKY